MSADPGTRDGRLGRSIDTCRVAVEELLRAVRANRQEAEEQEAVAHATLYAACAVSLEQARDALKEAHDLMAHTDPEDFLERYEGS